MTEAQIKHMVGRFLNWKLPEGFNPDGGVTFEKVANKGTPHEYTHQPSGTNLLDGTQAEALVRYMLEGLPKSNRKTKPQPRYEIAEDGPERFIVFDNWDDSDCPVFETRTEAIEYVEQQSR